MLYYTDMEIKMFQNSIDTSPLMYFPSSLSKSSRNKNYRLTQKNECTRGKHLVLPAYIFAVLL